MTPYDKYLFKKIAILNKVYKVELNRIVDAMIEDQLTNSLSYGQAKKTK